MITARHYDNAADILAGAHAVHMRLMKPKNAVMEIKSLPGSVSAEPVEPPPLWMRERIQFNEHVNAWTVDRFRREHQRYQTYIRGRCDEVGIEYAEVIGRSKGHAIAKIRQDIIYELRTNFTPPPSFNELARIFNRDHSTCVHAAQAGAKRANKPKLKSLSHLSMLRTDKGLAKRVKFDFLAGKSLMVLSERHMLSRESIGQFIKEKNWTRERPQSFYLTKTGVSYETALKVKDAYYAGFSGERIAVMFKISVRTIGMIRKKYGWPARSRVRADD